MNKKIEVFDTKGITAQQLNPEKIEDLLKDLKSKIIAAKLTGNDFPPEVYHIGAVLQVVWNEWYSSIKVLNFPIDK